MPRLFCASGCPNCRRFIEALNATSAAASVQRVDVAMLTPDQRRTLRYLPTLVLDDGRALTGTAAFEWLKQFDSSTELGTFEAAGGLCYSEVADESCTLKYTTPWSAFEPPTGP